MMDALKTTFFGSIFLGICWIVVFNFVPINGPALYVVLSLPAIAYIFVVSFEWHLTSREKTKYFREMKRLEIELEFQKEFASWVPPDVRDKWWDEGEKAIELYKKKMELWRNP